jgi:hypothetical protein
MNTTKSLSVITTEIGRLPSRLRFAGRTASKLQRRTLKLTKHNPGRALVGAFAVGLAIAGLSRLVTS